MKKKIICITIISLFFCSMIAGAETIQTNDFDEPVKSSGIMSSSYEGIFLYPNGDGSVRSDVGSCPSESDHFMLVDDPIDQGHDGNATYIKSADGEETFLLDDPLENMEDHICSVEVYTTTIRPEGKSNYAIVSPAVYTNNKFYTKFGSSHHTKGIWTTFCSSWTKNPSSLESWTWSEIQDLEIGIEICQIPGVQSYQRCTQIYAVINTEPTPYLYTNDNIAPSWPRGEGFLTKLDFEIYNCGNQESGLDWEIVGHPGWGCGWTFTPSSGTDVSFGMIPVDVSFRAPDLPEGYTEKTYHGTITICNSENDANFETVDISIKVKHKFQSINLILQKPVDRLLKTFPLLERLLDRPIFRLLTY